ncbi:hypothetical protein H0R92_02565 [Treponema sp. OMZ 840]|uniref:hypothetical protein n=1 Tax=Treponema sp. OMZ 840 TaxID=244313 RepID=UPI003D8A4E77
MSKKKNKAAVFLITVCVLIFSVLIVFFVRHIGHKEKIADLPSLPPLRIEEPPIASYTPYFYPCTDNGATLFSMQPFFERHELRFSLSDDFYRLVCTGMFERLDAHYDGKIYADSSWTYNSEYPILCPPCLFSDSIVFMDARPSLIVLDIKTGKVLQSLQSPVYPSGEAAVKNGVFIFRGKNSSLYEVRFENRHSDKADFLNVKESIDVKTLFSPSVQAADLIREKTSEWLRSSQTFALPVPALLFDAENPEAVPAVLTDKALVCFTVFSPDEQGVYTAGLCTPKGKWLAAPAFAAVFSDDGVLQAVSIDYVSDKPQVKMHFSDKALYYIVCAFFLNEREEYDKNTSLHVMVKKSL